MFLDWTQQLEEFNLSSGEDVTGEEESRKRRDRVQQIRSVQKASDVWWAEQVTAPQVQLGVTTHLRGLFLSIQLMFTSLLRASIQRQDN